MSVSLRRDNRGRHYWRNHRRWWRGRWSSGRARHEYRREDGEHHAARKEREKELEAVPRSRLRRRAGGAIWTLSSRALSYRLARTVILAVIDARAGNGRSRVPCSLRILAHMEAAHTR
jgi:hypothetical protein